MKNTPLSYSILIALLICSNCIAQKSNYVVTESKDTIYVDKINITDTKLKTKTNGKKKNYRFDKIISFYDFGENKYYERLTNEIKEKKELSKTDRYNYRKLENIHVEDYENRVKYTYIERLTNGKVKLFTQGSVYRLLNNMPNPSNFNNTYDNVTYYISIYDSKLERIFTNSDLKMNDDIYEVLKIYLHGNNEIKKRLDVLYLSKPKAKKEQIVNLINDYNKWVESNK